MKLGNTELIDHGHSHDDAKEISNKHIQKNRVSSALVEIRKPLSQRELQEFEADAQNPAHPVRPENECLDDVTGRVRKHEHVHCRHHVEEIGIGVRGGEYLTLDGVIPLDGFCMSGVEELEDCHVGGPVLQSKNENVDPVNDDPRLHDSEKVVD